MKNISGVHYILLFILLLSCKNSNNKGVNAHALQSNTLGSKYIKVVFNDDRGSETICDYVLAKKIASSPIAKEVTSLNVYDNDDIFDEFLYSFTSVNTLEISSINAITYEIDFNRFENLEEVIIYKSNIDSLFLNTINNSQIKRLEISMCNISYIGQGVEGLSALQYLRINECPHVNIDFDFSYLRALKELTIFGCKLHKVPKGVEYCYNLNLISFSNNYLDSIPDSYTNLTKLTYYDFSFNKFISKPNVLNHLDQFVKDGLFYQTTESSF